MADKELWTHIILPLGIEHQVKKISKGVRISYVKEIWVIEEEEEIETDQEREIRENARNMRGRMGWVDWGWAMIMWWLFGVYASLVCLVVCKYIWVINEYDRF